MCSVLLPLTTDLSENKLQAALHGCSMQLILPDSCGESSSLQLKSYTRLQIIVEEHLLSKMQWTRCACFEGIGSDVGWRG